MAPSGADPPAPVLRAALSEWSVARGCLGGMRNEGATDLPQWCYVTFHATSSGMEGREDRIQGSIWLRVNLS